MQKVILLRDGKSEIFETLKDLYQSLSEEGVIITEVIDGLIKTSDKKEFEFGLLNIEKTKENLINEVEEYRKELRESISLLKKQGINVPKDELTKLAKQFEFVGVKNETKKKES